LIKVRPGREVEVSNNKRDFWSGMAGVEKNTYANPLKRRTGGEVPWRKETPGEYRPDGDVTVPHQERIRWWSKTLKVARPW
jgi:hypothetical protein